MPHASRRRTPLGLALALTALALALVAACAAMSGPGREYRAQAQAMSGPDLLRERLRLTGEIARLDGHGAELDAQAARGHAVDPERRDNLAAMQDRARARLRYVNKLLDEGRVAVHELRYKVEPAPAPPETPAPPPAAMAEKSTPALAPEPAKREPTPWEPQQGEASTPEPAPAPAPRAETPAAPAPAAGSARVTAVAWSAGDGTLEVRIAVSGDEAPRCRVMALDDPPRIVVDVLGVSAPPRALPATVSVDSPLARRIRLGWHPEGGYQRVVLDATGPGLTHRLETTPGEVRLIAGRP